MGKMIEFKRPDGKSCAGYLATPKAGESAPGFVVIQEWWGLNDQMKNTADRLAEAGYRALVPDLFRGKVATSVDEANHLMSGLNFPDAAGEDVRGAVQYLKQSSKSVAVGGFCMGGAVTLLAAGLFKNISTPLILHYANIDDWCTPEKVNEVEAALKQSKSKFEFYRYNAKHAFMNEARSEVYDAASAKTAWERTLAFLSKALPAASSAQGR
jgi:carboxymethylenebutenolidase